MPRKLSEEAMTDAPVTESVEAPAPAPKVVQKSDAYSGSPAEDPMAQALAEESAKDEAVTPKKTVEKTPEPKAGKSVEHSAIEYILGDDEDDIEEPAEEGETPAEDPESDDDAEVVLSKADYEKMMSMLNDSARAELESSGVATDRQEIQQQAEEAPAPPVRQELPPINLQLDENDFLDVVSDPAKFAEYMENVVRAAQQSVLEAVNVNMSKRALDVYGAMEFSREFFNEYPQFAQYPELARLALAKAQAKLGSNATRDALKKATAEELVFVTKKTEAIKKSGERRDARGRFAPKPAARTARAGLEPTKKADLTQSALAEIAGVSPDSPDAERYLRAMGA